MKKKIYTTQAKLDLIAAGQTVVIEGESISLANIDDYEFYVKYVAPDIPVKGVKVGGTKLEPDENGDVNIPEIEVLTSTSI